MDLGESGSLSAWARDQSDLDQSGSSSPAPKPKSPWRTGGGAMMSDPNKVHFWRPSIAEGQRATTNLKSNNWGRDKGGGGRWVDDELQR